MRNVIGRHVVGILCVAVLAVSPAFAELPQVGVIDPGRGIGPAALGMAADQLLGALGRADFEQNGDEGSVLYEWGLLSEGDVPDAVLWALVDDGIVVKVGTDGAKYRTSSGLSVGSSADEFVKQFGLPTQNPVEGSYLFRQGIGIAVGPDGKAIVIWIEDAAR